MVSIGPRLFERSRWQPEDSSQDIKEPLLWRTKAAVDLSLRIQGQNGTDLWGVGRCVVEDPNGERSGKSLLRSTIKSASAVHERGHPVRTLGPEQE
jgi:hypothetical protein